MIPDAWAPLRGLAIRPCDDGGLINKTFVAGDPVAYVVQWVNPIFTARVHEDIEAVTAHLATRGMVTPRLVRTDSGALFAEGEGIWRAMTWIPGATHHRVTSPGLAAEGAALVARFHRALDDFEHIYANVREGAHDTPKHMRGLEEVLSPGDAEPVAHAILDAWRGWQGRLDLPDRHCHGDLKISNVRFSEGGEALCLLDLDTLARLPLDVELGDAMRSWCNPRGEDVTDTQFDASTFSAAMSAYTRVRPLSADEREGVAAGPERISLELAARFCRDVYVNKYFGWDEKRFPSRPAHNLHRAKGQLSLALSARRQRAQLEQALR